MPIDQSTRQRKNERSKFKRRCDRLTGYVDEIGKLFKSKAYLLVKSQDSKFVVYNNCAEKHWPPRSETLNPQEYYTPENLNFNPKKSKFEKRKRQLLLYANKTVLHFSAKVYLLIQCESGYIIVYNSTPLKGWPLSRSQVRGLGPLAHRKGPQDFDDSPA